MFCYFVELCYRFCSRNKAGIMRRFGMPAVAVLGILPASGASGAELPLLIAPHLSGEAFCASAAANNAIVTQEDAVSYCAERNENAASRITTFLDSVGPAISPSGHFALGYTLSLPMLQFYRKSPSGAWLLDHQAISAAIRTVHDVKRPVVVYLSANHFTDGGIKLSDELAKDPTNLMWTSKGPLKTDQYFAIALHAWTLADPDAPITRMRRAAFTAVIDELCRLDPSSRSRIAAVSVLGEVHQLFPDLATDQGYSAGFDVTDYSPKAIVGFRAFLRAKFSTIDALNTWAGSAFGGFDTIQPPAKDIRHDRLDNFFQHIDPFAAGIVAVQGWAFDPSGGTPVLSIYLDGRFEGLAMADLNRTDVAEANHTVTRQNVGWRYNLDYRGEKPGVHTLEIFLEDHGRKTRITSRGLTVVARDQGPSPVLPVVAVQAEPADPKSPVLVNVDGPAPLTPLFYNPLAQLWLEYRRKMVADYITSFAKIAGQSCLSHDIIFSHQILPQLNSSWDADLLAADASQLPNPAYRPGATLYGGATYGQSFFDWKNAEGWTDYGVSEMNPRFNFPVTEFEAMFEAHRRNGARFIAPYFMSITPDRVAPPAGFGLNEFKISPENHRLGSDLFYQAISDTMRHR